MCCRHRIGIACKIINKYRIGKFDNRKNLINNYILLNIIAPTTNPDEQK
jgi:hypothetical protein